jgi:CubicO group peptidase (beta-lactamase class C family)
MRSGLRWDEHAHGEWIRVSTAPHSQAPDGPYGYHWWGRPEGYTARGFGGQYVYVFPAQQLVVVLTADPEAGEHIGSGTAERLFDQYIIGALRPR